MAMTYNATVGGALVRTGTGGAAALESLGIPKDGVKIEITKHDKRVMTDVSGPDMPAELQEMGMSAKIRCTLIAVDLAVALKIKKGASETTEGTTPAIGSFLGGLGQPYAFRLLIDSTTDTPYNFLTAKLVSWQEKKSSQHNEYDVEFFAWAYLAPTATTAAAAVLYNSTRT